MKNLIIILFVTIVCATASFAQVIKLSPPPRAYSDGSNIILQWNTEDETNVTRFIIERRAGTSGPFIQVRSIEPKGPSMYEFVDNTAFRSTATLYQYQIRIKFANGIPDKELEQPVSVSHSVNSVKRTWGSIKAMFR
jgi:hypothetical protein